ncbi:MAG: hypothetical protein K1X81_02790 [Bacteroidia bacterium]|nr:hypothetical protein [Bacteroidia bacterium]
MEGYIIGLYPSPYVSDSTKKQERWYAKIRSAEFKERDLIFRFGFEGYDYVVYNRTEDGINYTGNLIPYDPETKCYLTLFSNEKGFFLTGGWDEAGDTYEVFIRLYNI